MPICFQVTCGSLNQINQSNKLIKRYLFTDIKQILLSNCLGGFILEIGEQRRRVC